MLTAPSSAAVIAFPPPAPVRFEAWREHWHRQVLEDRQLSHRDKSVAGILLWYLNREERACFPSNSTIAKGVGITPRDVRRSVTKLVARGHLLRQRRERKTNNYLPQVGAPCPQGGGTLPLDARGKITPLTSEDRTSDLTLGEKGKSERGLSGEATKTASDVPTSFPSQNGCDVPRAPDEGGGGAVESVWIDYYGDDPWKWEWIQKLGPLATGKTYRKATRSKGFPLPKAEWEAIKAAAVRLPHLVVPPPRYTNGGGRR